MRRIWFLSPLMFGFLFTVSTPAAFAGDDPAQLRCEPKPPPVHCGTPTPDPTPPPTPKPTPVVRDHRHPPVATGGPIIRDHRTPVVATGPTIRDHRTPKKPKYPVASGPYQVPAPKYTPRPTVKTPVDTSQAPGGVVVTSTPRPRPKPKAVVKSNVPSLPIPVIKVPLPF